MNDEAAKNDVIHIIGKSGITHNGRFFSPEPIRGTVAKLSYGSSSGKVELSSNQEPNPANRGILLDKVDKFMNIIKRSEYKVVD